MNITKISDFLSGKNVEEYYQLYKSTQWYDKKRMEEYQFNKLRNLIIHVHENVPFYKKYMADKDITPDDFTSIKSLELFPIITKEIIQDNYKAFIPENIEKIKGVKTGQTGGTTGNILYNRNDAATRSSTWAAFITYGWSCNRASN
jgi:phenylacetate-CoA ligase